MRNKDSRIRENHKKQAATNGVAQGVNGKAQSEFKPNGAWCKRNGHNRICLTCGQNAKSRPNGCSHAKHHRSFSAKRAYNRRYWRKNKKRLLVINRHYRQRHPGIKKWMRQYHRQWYAQNRARKLAQNRTWGKRNAKKRKKYLRRKALEWYRRHRRRALANNRRYYERHKVRKNSRRNAQLKARRKRDPGARVLYNFRSRLSTLIRKGGRKMFSITRGVLLYSGQELRAHLEKQFTSLMNWANYGKYWEVDHVQGCASFDLTRLDQCRKCFVLPNLRPLEIKLNRGRFHAERRKAMQAKFQRGNVRRANRGRRRNSP